MYCILIGDLVDDISAWAQRLVCFKDTQGVQREALPREPML
jgi:hypothetical protein